MSEKRPSVEIYTDGGAKPNPGPGGWGAVLIWGHRTKELIGGEPDTTNNRMELTAAIEALSLLKRSCDVTLYTDSQYLRRGITEWLSRWQANGWCTASGRSVENKDLWQRLSAEVGRHHVDWQWVRGHRGNPLNERADRLATEGRRRAERQATALQQRPNPVAPRTPLEDTMTRDDAPRVTVYTRGCVLGVKDGPGGYAAILVPDNGRSTSDVRVFSGSWPSATSNIMELWAAIAALRALAVPSHVTVKTVSKYVSEGASKWLGGWERRGWVTSSGQAVKNKEIWQELAQVMGDHDIRWEYLPPSERTEHADAALSLARQEAKRLADTR